MLLTEQNEYKINIECDLNNDVQLQQKLCILFNYGIIPTYWWCSAILNQREKL